MTQSPNHPMLVTLRAALPVTAHCTYFQTGSLGPLSRPVLQAMHEAEWLAAQEGPAAPDGLQPLVAASEGARVALARLLHVPATELAWSLNTSTAMRTVVHSLRLTSADQLITSDQEHVATRSLYHGLLAMRWGCRSLCSALRGNRPICWRAGNSIAPAPYRSYPAAALPCLLY
ncbi:MAG: hypothetical protein R3E79_25000 [Caldilineaceae bacterium]